MSLAASALPSDKTYANQLKAGAILEKIFIEEPDHPGITHYIIHSYDVPPLAPRAVSAARRYATIAPSAPHALHMPSHTFTRVGSWQESIDTNIASAAAARRDHAIAEELHATDYQMYAYLQTAQDTAARKILDSLPEISSHFDPNAVGSAAPGSAGIFALAAIPARYALERQAWAEAAKLQPTASAFPYTEAMTYFARALGASHVKDLETARSAVAALQQIRDRLTQTNEAYWAEQVEIERRGAAAWTALAEGRNTDALALMRSAAELEDGTEKNAVTPGPIAPARELLGEMLLQMHEPALALKEFQATLKKGRALPAGHYDHECVGRPAPPWCRSSREARTGDESDYARLLWLNSAGIHGREGWRAFVFEKRSRSLQCMLRPGDALEAATGARL